MEIRVKKATILKALDVRLFFENLKEKKTVMLLRQEIQTSAHAPKMLIKCSRWL